jgi:hypothetical protein
MASRASAHCQRRADRFAGCFAVRARSLSTISATVSAITLGMRASGRPH